MTTIAHNMEKIILEAFLLNGVEEIDRGIYLIPINDNEEFHLIAEGYPIIKEYETNAGCGISTFGVGRGVELSSTPERLKNKNTAKKGLIFS